RTLIFAPPARVFPPESHPATRAPFGSRRVSTSKLPSNQLALTVAASWSRLVFEYAALVAPVSRTPDGGQFAAGALLGSIRCRSTSHWWVIGALRSSFQVTKTPFSESGTMSHSRTLVLVGARATPIPIGGQAGEIVRSDWIRSTLASCELSVKNLCPVS